MKSEGFVPGTLFVRRHDGASWLVISVDSTSKITLELYFDGVYTDIVEELVSNMFEHSNSMWYIISHEGEIL